MICLVHPFHGLHGLLISQQQRAESNRPIPRKRKRQLRRTFFARSSKVKKTAIFHFVTSFGSQKTSTSNKNNNRGLITKSYIKSIHDQPPQTFQTHAELHPLPPQKSASNPSFAFAFVARLLLHGQSGPILEGPTVQGPNGLDETKGGRRPRALLAFPYPPKKVGNKWKQ